MLDIKIIYIIVGVIAALAAIITKTGRKIIAGIAAIAVAFALHGAARAEAPLKEVFGEIIAVDVDDGIVYVETDSGEIYSYFADGVITIGRVKLIIFGNDEVIDVELEQPSGCLLFYFFMRCVQPQENIRRLQL